MGSTPRTGEPAELGSPLIGRVPENLQKITGIPANPGDEVFTEVWIGNSNGALNQNGGCGLFYYENLATGQATEFETPLSGTYFNGTEAEWIMERPTV